MSLKNTIVYIKAIENFHFKFTAVTSQRGAGGIAMMYSRAARDLRTAANEHAKRRVCSDLCDRFASMQPDFAEFTIGFNEIYYSKEFTSQRNLVRYILEKIHRQQNPLSSTNYEEMTVEHLLPQDANETEETKACLGNLLFLNKNLNEKLKNKDFTEKKKILIASGYKLDAQIINAGRWTRSEIHKRQSQLAQLSYELIWKV